MNKLNEEHKEFLLNLRDSGATNMLGAAPLIKRQFKISIEESNLILKEWIEHMNSQPKESVSLGDILDAMDRREKQ